MKSSVILQKPDRQGGCLSVSHQTTEYPHPAQTARIQSLSPHAWVATDTVGFYRAPKDAEYGPNQLSFLSIFSLNSFESISDRLRFAVR
jgi:hypothetical protein